MLFLAISYNSNGFIYSIRGVILKVSFYTLGCKVNQNETASMKELFLMNDYTLAEKDEPADVYIVNSCTVTAGGDRKSLQWLRRAKRANPNAVTVLTGCLPQAFPEKTKQILEADIITGSKNRHSLLQNIDTFLHYGNQIWDIAPYEKEDLFEDMPVAKMQEHTRAFVKIEDGCNRFCTYCIIPYARGPVRSRSEESILNEIKVLGENGYSEIVLTGINLACYGNDTSTDLPSLVEKISQNANIQRIRLGSLEPDFLSEEQFIALSKQKKLCPHFHFSLQNGSDKTLSRMNRSYSTAFYKSQLHFLKSLFPSATFTTDIIVGFPGETDEDFKESLDFIISCEFFKIHAFTYSPRPGTAAASFPDQIPSEVKQLRRKALVKAAQKVQTNVAEEFLGSSVKVLLEKPIKKDTYTGYTENYLPVLLYAPKHSQGDIVSAVLQEFKNERFTASHI